MSQLHLASTIPLLTLLKMCPWRQRTLLALNLKKTYVGYFLKKYSAKRVLLFLLHQMLLLFSITNLVYVLEINIFERVYSNLKNLLQDINLLYFCKVYCKELGQYLMQFDAFLKKCNETTNYSI